MKRLLKDYKSFFESWKVNEADAGFNASESSEMLDQANIKIKRAIVWININKSFYANVLQYVNIYGTMDLDPKTMATNGESIMFHPEFVLEQTDGAIRFVLCHEILHCLNEHHERRGKRNPVGWNIACDYAINPLLDGEEGFEWPQINGKRVGLYEERFKGWTAEQIYETLQEENRLNEGGEPQKGQERSIDKVLQSDEDAPISSGPMVQKGQFEDEDEDEDGEKGGKNGKEGEEGKEESDDKGEPPPPKLPPPNPPNPGQASKPNKDNKDREEAPSVGDRVRLRDGKEAVVKGVYPDGSIEI